MTREEKISKAAYSQYCNSESICFTMMCDSFKQGAKWADEHPKSPWISVEEDLPCNHEELIENKIYTKNVLVVFAWNNDPSKRHIGICDMCNKIGSFNTNWYWRHISYFHVVYWMPLPELPKE